MLDGIQGCDSYPDINVMSAQVSFVLDGFSSGHRSGGLASCRLDAPGLQARPAPCSLSGPYGARKTGHGPRPTGHTST